jgi:RimJ/RimL family protein N-acetyltransferase
VSEAPADPVDAGSTGERAGRVTIEPVTERDLRELNRLVNDPVVARYLDLAPPVPFVRTVDFYRYIREQQGAWWVLRVDGVLAGSVGLIPADPASRLGHTASLFVYLDPAWWGRGLGRRAVEAMVAEAGRRGLVRIEVLVVDGNDRSVRLFRACGFAFEGFRCDGFRADDGYRDLIQFARILH